MSMFERFLLNIAAVAAAVFLPSLLLAAPGNVKEVEMQGGPTGMAVDEAKGRLFVLNHSADSLAVVDEKELTVVKTIMLNRNVNPNVDGRSVAYDPAADRVYLSTGGDGVLVLDGSSYETVMEIRQEGKRMFVPDLALGSGFVYLSDWYNYIHRYAGDGRLDASIKIVDAGSIFMHLGPLARVYVTSTKGEFFVIDPGTGKTLARLSMKVLSIPESHGDKVYVAGEGSLYVIDAVKLEVVKVVKMDVPSTSGFGMAVNPDTGQLFIVTSGDTVTVFDANNEKIVDRVKVCQSPKSIAVNKATNTIYVACPQSDKITILK